MSKPKLRTYKLFKTNFGTSDYVINVLNRYKRSLLARFRTGILQLRIETGRFNQVKLDDRLCLVCNENVIEDEFHFLCVCSKYSTIREELFTKIITMDHNFQDLPLNDKFIFIMSNYCEIAGCFIRKAWDVRKSIIFK